MYDVLSASSGGEQDSSHQHLKPEILLSPHFLFYESFILYLYVFLCYIYLLFINVSININILIRSHNVYLLKLRVCII